MSEYTETPDGIGFMAKTLAELEAGDEQVYGLPAPGATVRMRSLRRAHGSVAPVLAVSKIKDGAQETWTFYSEAEARGRFAQLVDQITPNRRQR